MFKLNKISIFFIGYIALYVLGIYFLKTYFNLSLNDFLGIIAVLMVVSYVLINIKSWVFSALDIIKK